MGNAEVQGQLWSARARAWSELLEQPFAPVYSSAFDAAQVAAGTKLVDVGCGAGLALRMAQERGADISGIDAAPQLVDIARSRCPEADIQVGELEDLPFVENSFDVVTGFNSFQYAANRIHALQEAQRVMKPGGRLVAAVWGQPENCQMGPYLAALGSLMPPPPPGAPGPWALSPPGALEELVEQAGLRPLSAHSVMTVFNFHDDDTATTGLLSSGPAVQAIQTSGEQAVATAVIDAIAPFKKIDGSYSLKNEFRFVVAGQA